MPFMNPGDASNCGAPTLDIYTRLNGVLADPASLEFRIIELDGDVQVFPATGWQAVTVGVDCPTGHRLATGRHVAAYTADVAANPGGYRIDWRFTFAATGAEVFTHDEEFTILATPIVPSSSYCSIQDIRDEGITSSFIGDVALQKKLDLASKVIERVTGNVFRPTAMTFRLDGRGDRRLTLAMPIISITEVKFVDTTGGETTVPAELYRVYNRHLTQRLLDPDDRFDPRIDYVGHDGRGLMGDLYVRFYGGRRWPTGKQNIEVEGFFGFTDWDAGNVMGITPPEIARACALLVVKDLPLLGDPESRWEEQNRSRITSVRTRDQQISLGGGGATSAGRAAGAYGYLTGDEEVDRLLEQFMAPVSIGHSGGW